jgi:hypothetical protein
MLPTANVLELTGDDKAQKYVIKVPIDVKSDEVFEILLDLRLFTAICIYIYIYIYIHLCMYMYIYICIYL